MTCFYQNLHGHEFRDPSTYASFYYPPEGQDTEREQSEAEQEAEECVTKDAAIYQEEIAKFYKDATVTGEVGEVIDEDVDEGRYHYHYTCKVKCNLRISIPKENFAGKNDDEISEELQNICSIEVPTEIEYEDVDENVTDTSRDIVLSGFYNYYYENDKE